MRFTRNICCALCFVVFMSLMPGCGSRNSSNPVTELSMPADDVLTSLPDNPDASLMLCDDGTYKIYTPDMDDNLQLLYWEYILTEEYFNEKRRSIEKWLQPLQSLNTDLMFLQ